MYSGILKLRAVKKKLLNFENRSRDSSMVPVHVVSITQMVLNMGFTALASGIMSLVNYQ